MVSNELRARQLNVEVLKSMSGGDETPVNRMRENPRNARITGTIHCQGNPASLPSVAVVDASITRRFVVIPAGEALKAQNPAVKHELMGKEQPAVLAWMMEGARRFAAMFASNEWTMPSVVERETWRWLSEASPLGRFITECCDTGPDRFDTSNHLYERFCDWRRHAGLRSSIPSQNAFGRALTDAGYPSAQRRVPQGCGSANTKVRVGLKAHGDARLL